MSPADGHALSAPPLSWERGGVAGLVATVTDAWIELGRPRADAVGIGIAAAPPLAERDALAAGLGASLEAERVFLASDGVTAHLGALGGAAGVALVVGTGVACVAWNPAGRDRPRAFDGHGPLLGDAGSGVWLGRTAVRLVLDAFQDGTVSGALAEGVEARLGPFAEIAARLHRDPRPMAALAALAPLVVESAAHDPIAAEVVRLATEGLAVTAHRAAVAGGLPTPVVALGGGVLSGDNLLRAALTERLETDSAIGAVVPAGGSPLEGARLLTQMPAASSEIVCWTREEQ
ncbi:MAG: hypothetical protein WAW88_16450 [Nocardioides sp.]